MREWSILINLRTVAVELFDVAYEVIDTIVDYEYLVEVCAHHIQTRR